MVCQFIPVAADGGIARRSGDTGAKWSSRQAPTAAAPSSLPPPLCTVHHRFRRWPPAPVRQQRGQHPPVGGCFGLQRHIVHDTADGDVGI